MKKLKLALAVLLVLAMATTVLAASVFSWFLEGASNEGKECADLDGTYADSSTTWAQFKLEGDDLADGTYSDGTLEVTLSMNGTTGFDWESDIGVDAIVVKDGVDGANFYVYDGLTSPADGTVGPSGGSSRDSEETSDTDLTTPNNGAKDISHISFCYDVGEEPETGSLEVHKIVNWGKFPVDTSQTFEICITGPSYPAGACETVPYNGGGITWGNISVGEYTVTETNPGTGWKVEITGSPAMVVKDEAAQAEVTNTREKATAIILPDSSFTAVANGGRVTLTWETATELDNAGFNLYRALLKDGPYTRVNDALIPAQGDPVSGASYSFLDTPDYGTFYYKLEDVDYNGASTMHGPVRATVARPLLCPLYRPTPPEF